VEKEDKLMIKKIAIVPYVTNGRNSHLNLKNLMVSGTKISGVAEILGDKVTFLAEFALRKALIRIDVAQHM